MKTVIIYGSCYGTSERYARELARQTGAELHAAKDLRDLTGCGLAVHIGGLYAGGLAELRQTLLRRPAASLTEEDRLLLETYGKEVDFTDLSALEPIAGVILSPKRP